MAFAEDLSPFFDLGGFGVAAQLHLTGGATRTINCLYDHPSQPLVTYDVAVEADSPHMLCQKADASGLARGNTVDVGGGTHKVVRIADDGTGLVTVYFE